MQHTILGLEQETPSTVSSFGCHLLLQLSAHSLAHSVRRRCGSHQLAFNRGGLTEGSAGIPVVDVAHQLRRKDRDDLYSANINPIAKFPAEGIVIFGQKTLQVTPSALDRINVRRLMIFVKKRISQIAAGLLFDPNVQQTWKRFTAQVNPFLADVKTNFGLSDYRVVLDDTTTTPDLVDRNILYAQIFLKPTRAIEFIAIDFNITRTGASFDD